MRIIGDVHHWTEEYYEIASQAETSIQLGDLFVGYGKLSDYWHEKMNKFHSSGKHRFIRGNHDSLSRCKIMSGWIPDGYIENNMMFIGGAHSINSNKQEGINWWADEELSEEQFEEIYDKYLKTKPEILITHDCPSYVSEQLFTKNGLSVRDHYIETRTGKNFQKMFDAHQPEQWIFGHWHHTISAKFGRTMFTCLSELDYIDI